MIQRDTYDNLIHTLQAIAEHHEGDPNVLKICKEVQTLRDGFDIKTVFIGHFNAGKSSLINALLQDPEFLAEAQVPQTDICAELKYGESNQVFAQKFDGTTEAHRDSVIYSPTEYQGIHYTLQNPALKELDGYAIIDTPGFDSFVESHELALSHYMSHGSVYLFVIDVEKGCIDDTTLTKIKTIYRRCPDIAVIFNKCDKMSSEQVEQVIAHAKSLLSTYMIRCPVVGLSKHDPDISRKLCDLISGFSAQDIFDRNLSEAIRDAAQRLHVILSTAAENVSLDTFNLDEMTLRLNRKRESLEKTLEQKSKSIKQEAPKKTSDILDTVRGELEGCGTQVASCLLMGSNQGAQAVIAETVRRTLSEAMAELADHFYVDVRNSLDFTGISPSADSKERWGAALESAGEKFSQMGGLDGLFPTNSDAKSKSKGGGTLYKAITGAGALLASAHPILEAVVIFLPEILQLCKKIFGESEESKIRRQYSDAIIPQVISTIGPHVENCVRNAMDTLLERTKEWINEHIESINRAITTAAEQKASSEQDYQNHLTLLKEDCQTLENIMQTP